MTEQPVDITKLDIYDSYGFGCIDPIKYAKVKQANPQAVFFVEKFDCAVELLPPQSGKAGDV